MHPTLVKFRESVVTRYIRIIPLNQQEFRVMRLEVYGCLKEPMPSHFGRFDDTVLHLMPYPKPTIVYHSMTNNFIPSFNIHKLPYYIITNDIVL